MYIIIDTSSIHNDFLLQRADVQKLSIVAKQGGHKIFIPQVTVEETHKHFHETLLGLQQEVSKSLKEFERKTGEILSNPIIDPSIQRHISIQSKKFIERIKELDLSVLPLTNTGHGLLLSKAVNRKKPFKEKGEGYQDALIWSSILDMANEFSKCDYIISPQIILVTRNYKDFCNSDKYELHSDLRADLVARHINPAAVKVVSDINSAFDLLHVSANDALLTDINAFIAQPGFWESELIQEAKNRLMDFLPYQSFESEEVGFPAAYEEPSIDMFEEDFKFETEGVEILSDTEISIKLNVSVTCLFDIFISKSDYRDMSDPAPSVYDFDWNDHCVAAQQEKNIWLTMDIVADSKLSSIQSCDIEINEERNNEGLPIYTDDFLFEENESL